MLLNDFVRCNSIYIVYSTSYIESLWHSLKSKILGTYKHIPNQYFVSYLCEAEFKVKNANKKYVDIVKEFFDCFENNMNLKDIIFESNDYLSDSDFINQNNGENEDD